MVSQKCVCVFSCGEQEALLIGALFSVCTYKVLLPSLPNNEVQTLGELRMRGTANGWAGLLAFPRGLPLVYSSRSLTRASYGSR